MGGNLPLLTREGKYHKKATGTVPETPLCLCVLVLWDVFQLICLDRFSYVWSHVNTREKFCKYEKQLLQVKM